MADNRDTRRTFLKTTSAAVAGAALSSLGSAHATPVDTSKILNYNPKMGYRPLGSTGFTEFSARYPCPIDRRLGEPMRPTSPTE